MSDRSGIITLLTDFGTRDAYVGALKGVILSIAPRAQIVDLSHEVVPQDVLHAAWVLRTTYRYFPTGTVHCAVVDPGVGSDRRAIAAEAGGCLFVAPDNGLLSWALDDIGGERRIVESTNSSYWLPYVSDTFHGRDIFAPVAAHVSAGVALEALGPHIDDPQTMPFPRPRVDGDVIHGEVLHVDRFGSLVSNIGAAMLDGWSSRHELVVDVADQRIAGMGRTYADAPAGALLAYVGSTDLLEIAVRDGTAAATLGVGRGAPVTVRRT